MSEEEHESKMKYAADAFPFWYTVAMFTAATMSMFVFALTNRPSLLLLAIIQYIVVMSRVMCFGLYKVMSTTSLMDINVIYNASLMWNHIASLLAAICTVLVAKHITSDDITFRLCVFWMFSGMINVVQRGLLFYLTSITIWQAYLPRIKSTVVAHEVICGLSQYVLKHAPSAQELKRRQEERPTKLGRKQSSIFDVEAGERLLNQRTDSTLKREAQFFGRGPVPLHSVHTALRMESFEDLNDPQAVHCLFDRIVTALRYGSTADTRKPWELMKPVAIKQSPPPHSTAPKQKEHARSIITEKDIQRIFSYTPALVTAAMDLLDHNGNSVIDRRDFLAAFGDMHTKREDLKRTIADYENMVNVLDNVLSFIALIVLIFLALVLMRINIMANSVLLISIFAATSIAFGSTLQGMFEGIIFAFSLRPYDIGDRIFVRDESMTEQNYVVEKITLMTTTMKRVDGIVVTILNSRLKAATIVNAYRAPNATHKFLFKLPVDVDISIMAKLQTAVEELPLEHVESVGVCILGVRADGMSTDGLLFAVQSCNFQDHDLRSRNQHAIGMCIHEFLRARNLPHIAMMVNVI